MKLWRRHVLAVLFLLGAAFFVVLVPAGAVPAATGINSSDLIYFLMTDRFSNGDPTNDQNVRPADPQAYHGGDFQGIINKLDYIKDLGFTTIWISPVVQNQVGGYHGYWATDFYKTNEHFGSMAELRSLVDQAHAKGIKVIVDLVVNHTGQLHPWVGEAQYQNWFHPRKNIANYSDQREVENGWLASLPDLNQENPEVKQYLINMAKWWIEETGIDGYRLDTVKHVSKDFWKDFAISIKQAYPHFYLLGEVFDGRADYVAGYQKTGIDGITDYPVYYAIRDVFGGYQPANRLVDAIRQAEANYPDPHLMGTFIDNHDLPRFVNQLYSLKQERLEQALAFEMTYTGIPVFYYGTEIGMDGGADPDNRRDMDWSTRAPETSSITGWVKKLSAIRRNNPALSRGDFQVIGVERDWLAYKRSYEGRNVLVVFNLSDRSKKLDLVIPQLKQGKTTTLTDLVQNRNIKIKAGKLRLNLKPRQAMIYAFADVD